MREVLNTEINARSALFVTVDYYDVNNVAEEPSLVRYCVVNLKDQSLIREWTTVTAAQSLTILIDSEDTKMISKSRLRERRSVVVEAEFSSSTDRDVSTLDFVIRRAGVPV